MTGMTISSDSLVPVDHLIRTAMHADNFNLIDNLPPPPPWLPWMSAKDVNPYVFPILQDDVNFKSHQSD